MTRRIATSLGCLSLIGVGAYFNIRILGSLELTDGLGPLSWSVAVVAVLSLLLSAVLCFLLERRSVPAWVPLAAPQLCMLLAAIGLDLSTTEVAEALHTAAPEQRLVFLAIGGAYSLGSGAVCFIWAGLAGVGCCVLAAAHGWEEASPEIDRDRWVWACLGGVGAILAYVMIVVTGAPPSVVLWVPGHALAAALFVLCGAPVLFLTIGRKPTGLETAQARRVTSARALGAAGFFGAVWSLGIAAALLPAASLLSLMQRAAPESHVANPVGPGAPELGFFIAATQKADIVLPIIAAVVAVLMLIRVLRWPRSWLPAVLCTVSVLGVSTWLLSPARQVRKLLPVDELCMTDCLPVDLVVALIARHRLPHLADSDRCDPPFVRDPVEPGFLDVPTAESDVCPFFWGTYVVVSAAHVSVDDICVTPLEDRAFPASVLRDGAEGYFVNPLFDRLTEAAQNQKLIGIRNPSLRFEGKALLAVDRHSSSRLVDQVIHTAAQAEFLDLWFLVRHPSRERPPAYRVVQVKAPRSLYGGSRPSSCAEDDLALALTGVEARGVCSGTYLAGPCVRVEVPGSAPCAEGAELSAEVWDATLTHDEVRLVSPDGRRFSGPGPSELVTAVKGHNAGREAVRVFRIRRRPDLPFARELELRMALVSNDAELFAAAYSIIGEENADLPPPPQPPPVASPEQTPCSSSDHRVHYILIEDVPTDEEIEALRAELEGEADASP